MEQTTMTASQYMQYDAHKKSEVIAYVAWFFLGLLGVHRFYLNRVGTGIIMLVLTVSAIGLLVSSAWWLIDAFLIPGLIREYNFKLAVRIGAVSVSDAQVPAGGQA